MPINKTHSWMRLIGERLRSENEDLTRDDLPRRWVDLIHSLNEQERKHGAQRAQGRPVDDERQGQ
jgi:hypothetical protein